MAAGADYMESGAEEGLDYCDHCGIDLATL
jgi:hypothetical protein